jgi:hypothetical protein
MEYEDQWRDIQEPWERLRWARIRWQKEAGAVSATAAHAAESIGMKEGTYRAYERPPEQSKHTPLDSQRAIQFGRRFKVNWVWLLTGEGNPFDHLPTLQERVIRAMSDLSEDDQAAFAHMVERFALKTGTKGG